MTIESRQLRYFVAVAEELNFRKAASRLHMSQPPLSAQIKALEAELGTVLLNRSKHEVSLTDSGRVLLDRAREALMRVDLASEAVRRAGLGEAGLIRIGFVGSMPMLDVFSPLLLGFRKQYPFVRLDLRHMSTGRQLRALDANEIDVAFVRPSSDASLRSIASVHLTWQDRLLLYVASDHPAALGGPVKLRDLAAETFVGIGPGVGCGVHDQTVTLCTAAGFFPKLSQEANDLRTVLWLVAAGVGVALLPACYVRAGVANVVAIPLADNSIESSVLMVTRPTEQPPLIRRFIEFATPLQHSTTPAGLG